MLYWIYELTGRDPDSVFKSVTLRAIVSGLSALLFTLLIGGRVIRKLVSLKWGQPIRTAQEVNKLNDLHGPKAGTPTMGGILIVAALLLGVLIGTDLSNPFVWVVLFVTLGLGGLGFRDDYLKISKKNSKGVSSRFKLVWQFGVSVLAAIYLCYFLRWEHAREFRMPFFEGPVVRDLGWSAVVLFVIVIVGASNAVNLTDGLDGLATGCTLTVTLAYGAFCYLASHAVASDYLSLAHDARLGDVVVICASLLGACMGFLWFNAHPAQVFMGDTGSLAIGGLLGTVAILCKQEALLVVVGGVFVLEATSVMLQVGYFKLTKRLHGQGQRLFRMTPIHHHFELGGWKETQVVVRFWILSIVFALIGIATLKLKTSHLKGAQSAEVPQKVNIVR